MFRSFHIRENNSYLGISQFKDLSNTVGDKHKKEGTHRKEKQICDRRRTKILKTSKGS
jgi:hypothetical protein